jgi:predicted HTH transcriptional regulator
MNATSPQQIDTWLSSPSEHQRLEFKEAKIQFDNNKLYRYCVAIANEGGGHLLLGVSDAPPRKVVGSQAFNNPIEMAEKLFRAVGFRVDIEEVQHPDGRVVVFHIPTRPLGTAYAYEGAYLMRVGEALTPMSEDQLRSIFAEGQPDWLEMAAKDGLAAQDVVDLLDTQTFFELLNLPYPSDRQGVLDKLGSERLANALIHQDFAERGVSAMVEIYVDRIEISNPGEPLVPVERFIDGYQSRNERLADLMRRFGICEEKSSGIDRAVSAAEAHQLPAPDFQVGFKRTIVIVFGPRSFRMMDRADRIRACYQHCALQWVQRQPMSNQTLRERFKLSESSSGTVSTILGATIEANLIKPDPAAPSGKKYARYLPIWA